MTAWLVALAVLAAVLTWGLNRELERLDRERRMREWLATSPAAARLKAQFEALSAAIGTALLPAMQQMADALIAAQPKFAEFVGAMRKAADKDPTS